MDDEMVGELGSAAERLAALERAVRRVDDFCAEQSWLYRGGDWRWISATADNPEHVLKLVQERLKEFWAKPPVSGYAVELWVRL